MNENMKKSYLIQRLKKPVEYTSPFSFGGGLKNGGVNEEVMKQLETVFSFDYMGAGEFEYGALPKTLNRMIDNFSDFIKGSMTVHWKTTSYETRKVVEGNNDIYFLCHKKQEKEIKRRIKSWAIGNNISGHPKYYVGLDCSFDNHQYCGWLELDNGFFFFADEEMLEKTYKLFIEE